MNHGVSVVLSLRLNRHFCGDFSFAIDSTLEHGRLSVDIV